MEKGSVILFRYDPAVDPRPYYQTYPFPFERGMAVMDVVHHIYEYIDGSFGFSYNCRNGHCGLCGAKINGQPGLMCREKATQELTLEPLDHMPIVRDLILDREHYETCLDRLRPFLDRVAMPANQPEEVGRGDLERFKMASRCVGCYNCLSVCPAYGENPHQFLGPAAIVQLARHGVDPRDALNREIIAYSAGIFQCTLCGKCVEVCPHGISPKENIEWLRSKVEAIKKGHTGRADRGS